MLIAPKHAGSICKIKPVHCVKPAHSFESTVILASSPLKIDISKPCVFPTSLNFSGHPENRRNFPKGNPVHGHIIPDFRACNHFWIFKEHQHFMSFTGRYEKQKNESYNSLTGWLFFTGEKRSLTIYTLRIGKNKETFVPRPNWLSISILPPWASIRCLTIDSPRPVPPSSRERVLSTR